MAYRPDVSNAVTLGMDFDDTLWHTTPEFDQGREALHTIVASVMESSDSFALDSSIEEHRIATYGYGHASFVLASIEALLATPARSRQLEIIEPLFEWARSTAEAPVRLLDGVEDVLPRLAAEYRLIGITRGSIPFQVDRFLRSGLGDCFAEVEVVGKKSIGRYESIFRRHGIDADRFVMVGDSLSADIAPVLELGGYGIHIPYPGGWDERRDALIEQGHLTANHRWTSVDSFRRVEEALDQLDVS